MPYKKEIENLLDCSKCKLKECIGCEITYTDRKKIREYIGRLEHEKQKLIEKLEERIKSVDKCYDNLIKPYYDEKLNIINVSLMSRKEKDDFINKKNCLLVQKYSFKEILEILKGESDD